jgi:hypothetical protein
MPSLPHAPAPGNPTPSTLDKPTRPLNLNDLTDAYRLPVDNLNRLAAPIVSALRAISAPVGRDSAGVALRGSLVFHPCLDNRPIAQLGAAYAYLRNRACQSGLIDALEVAAGIVG